MPILSGRLDVANSAVTTTAIDVWAITVTSMSEDEQIYMTSSIQPPPFPITMSTYVTPIPSIELY